MESKIGRSLEDPNHIKTTVPNWKKSIFNDFYMLTYLSKGVRGLKEMSVGHFLWKNQLVSLP